MLQQKRKNSMKNEIAKNVMELQNALISAGLNYEIWWVYKEKENRRRFVDTLNNYPLFFQTSIHAHFVAMIISIYRIHETRKDTINLHQLIRKLVEQKAISPKDINKIQSDVKLIKPLWVKISVLRNKMFAHRSTALEHNDIWKEANVTPNQFKELIDKSKNILNDITTLWNKNRHVFNLTSTRDTVKLLEDLKHLNETRKGTRKGDIVNYSL